MYISSIGRISRQAKARTAKLNLALADLNVETFSTKPEAAADDRNDSSSWCDTDRECSSACLHATNVCRLC